MKTKFYFLSRTFLVSTFLLTSSTSHDELILLKDKILSNIDDNNERKRNENFCYSAHDRRALLESFNVGSCIYIECIRCLIVYCYFSAEILINSMKNKQFRNH